MGTLSYTLAVRTCTIAKGEGRSLTLVVAAFTGAQLFAAVGSILVAAASTRVVRARSWPAEPSWGPFSLVGVAAGPNLLLFALAWVTGVSLSTPSGSESADSEPEIW